jgi:hypothetical protein
MIEAMLTLVVVALLMVVALMFAAEIGWLMIDPAPPPAQAHRVKTERRATRCAGREASPRGNDDRSRNASGSV